MTITSIMHALDYFIRISQLHLNRCVFISHYHVQHIVGKTFKSKN